MQERHIANNVVRKVKMSWWRHQMETFSALLAICAGNSPVPGEFPIQKPATRSFDVFFDLRLHKRLSKQWWSWWFETLSRPLWRHRYGDRWKCLTSVHISGGRVMYRAGPRFAPSQWETSLQSNAVSHWLGASLKAALYIHLNDFTCR